MVSEIWGRQALPRGDYVERVRHTATAEIQVTS